jgi:hypothetical protein
VSIAFFDIGILSLRHFTAGPATCCFLRFVFVGFLGCFCSGQLAEVLSLAAFVLPQAGPLVEPPGHLSSARTAIRQVEAEITRSGVLGTKQEDRHIIACLLDIMGKLIKNHWARLIVLVAATYQIGAGVQGFFWPKIFWDWLTKTLDPAVKPLPILQVINVVFGVIMLAWEWPLGALAGTAFHRSLECRLALLPVASLAAVLLYQGTNAGIYYVVALVVYFWAYSEGEIVCAKPWTLPQRGRGLGSV